MRTASEEELAGAARMVSDVPRTSTANLEVIPPIPFHLQYENVGGPSVLNPFLVGVTSTAVPPTSSSISWTTVSTSTNLLQFYYFPSG